MFQHLRRNFNPLASLSIRGLSVLAGFAITFYIGRNFGPVANGQYAMVTQTAMFLSVVAVGGLDMAVVKEFSAAVAKKIPLARATFVRIMLQSLALAALIAAVLIIGGNDILVLLGPNAIPSGGLAILCLLVVARTMTRTLSAVLRSQKSYILGQAVEVLIIPGIVTVTLVLGLAHNLNEILWVTAGAGALASVVGLIFSFRFTSQKKHALSIPAGVVFKVALPLWGVAIALNFAEWYSLASVSSVLGIYEAGLYRVALQIGTALAIVSMGLFSVYSAQIGAAHHASDRAAIGRIARTATRVSTLLVLPPTLLLFVFAAQVLALIGPQFVAAENVLRIIVAGQALYVITGPSGMVLALIGHQRINLWITGISTVLTVILVPFGALYAGITGVAVFVATMLVSRNIASLYAVWRLEKLNVLTGKVVDEVGSRD